MTAKSLLKSLVPQSAWKEAARRRRELQRAISLRRVHYQGTEIDAHVGLCDGYEGKRILEVGACPSGRTVARFKKIHGAREVVGVNIALQAAEVLSIDCRLEPIDARNTPYPDNYFDLVYSTSAFEHIHRLDLLLAEMHRVLRPGGRLFSHFGPIWSGSYGHHLWLKHKGIIHNYWNTKLPPYCHLLMTPETLTHHCLKLYDEELTKMLVEYVFSSKEQNQYFFEDYVGFVENSNFRPIYFKGYDHPELASRYTAKPFADTINLLLKKYSPKKQFLYDGIELLLEKIA